MELAISSMLDATFFSRIGGVKSVGDRSDEREKLVSGVARVGSVGVCSDCCDGDSLNGGDGESSVDIGEHYSRFLLARTHEYRRLKLTCLALLRTPVLVDFARLLAVLDEVAGPLLAVAAVATSFSTDSSLRRTSLRSNAAGPNWACQSRSRLIGLGEWNVVYLARWQEFELRLDARAYRPSSAPGDYCWWLREAEILAVSWL